MYIPIVRERVEIAGRAGAFMVVDVNRNRELADLIALTGYAYCEEDIPFAAIRPYEREAPIEPN